MFFTCYSGRNETSGINCCIVDLCHIYYKRHFADRVKGLIFIFIFCIILICGKWFNLINKDGLLTDKRPLMLANWRDPNLGLCLILSVNALFEFFYYFDLNPFCGVHVFKNHIFSTMCRVYLLEFDFTRNVKVIFSHRFNRIFYREIKHYRQNRCDNYKSTWTF